MMAKLHICLALALAAPLAAAGDEAQTAKASALIGKAVKNMQGEALGKVRDLVVDLDDKRVRYAIIERQGKLHRYSLAQFDPAPEGSHVVLYLSARRLEDSPGMDPEWQGYGLARASDLLGRKVEDRKGRGIGELTEIMIDWRYGTVPFALVGGSQVPLDALAVRGKVLVLAAQPAP